MSDTIQGTCGHDWIDFGCFARGELDDDQFWAVDAQVDACDPCLAELREIVRVSLLLDVASAVLRLHSRRY
jgi:hypothetical protein